MPLEERTANVLSVHSRSPRALDLTGTRNMYQMKELGFAAAALAFVARSRWRSGHRNQCTVIALSIGQTPRPGLCAPLLALLPGHARLLEAGALDGLDEEQLAALTARAASGAGGGYPLITSLRDGRVVRVEESDLVPLLTAAMARAVLAVPATAPLGCGMLLCAGSFADVRSPQCPLVKPFEAARLMLEATQPRRPAALAVLCPAGQEAAIGARWRAAGFPCALRAANMHDGKPCSVAEMREVDAWLRGSDIVAQVAAAGADGTAAATAGVRPECVVIDYVGSVWAEQLDELAVVWGIPVVDLGALAMQLCASLVGQKRS